MIDLLINSLILIFLYVMAFSLYYAIVVFASTKKHALQSQQKFSTTAYNNNIVVIIYAQNDEKTVVPMLEMLNKQTYPKNNYQIHIILDNCTDDSANKLEFIGGAKVWRLSDGAPMGKDEAISWLLERLISFQNVNAFAFLNANRVVDENFLTSVNASLFKSDIVVGSTEIVLGEKPSFYERMIDRINRYSNNIIKTGRSVLRLAARIDSDVVAIKQEVIEKIRCVDFKDVNSELKYTVLLTRNNFVPIYSPEVKTWVDIASYNSESPSVSYRFSLFKHCFKMMFSRNWKFSEFILNMFTPNVLLLLMLLIGIAVFSYNYYFIFDFPLVATFAALLIGAFIASIAIEKQEHAQFRYLFAYPFYSIFDRFVLQSPIYKFFKKLLAKKEYINVEKATLPVIVTDGKNNINCFLDLISEDGLVKVIFKYKKKRYVTDSHIRMCDAIKDITDKLFQHGFRIKICQTCAYFSPKIDGTTNMLKGFCNRAVVTDELSEPTETLLWNTCEFYLPEDLNKIVNINTYKKEK
ncbi:MAG: glycosyltransferase family 2 protein [Candidatus Gastranaerophilales bacterium]|nr:glycosyltransferase family 2 protein [Candidatus Gastranaerophilales bacterium]